MRCCNPKTLFLFPTVRRKRCSIGVRRRPFKPPRAWPFTSGEAMALDGNDQNKMEVFAPRDVRVERRRVLPGGLRPAKMEKPPDLVAWWRIIRKRRWTVLTAFVVLFLTVLVGSVMEKPVYRAKAMIEIDKEDPNVANPQELFQVDEVSDAYLETQYKVLGSDDLAERVIHELA